MKNLSLSQIAHHLSLPHPSQRPILSFSIDSRKVEPGALFFALPGAKVDGHEFLEEAAKRGAIAAIVSKQYRGSDYGLDLLAVEDVRQTLQTLGCIAAEQRKGLRIALTGSVGKTTTKEFLASILKQRFSTQYTEGNANSQLSFPLFWLNLDRDYEVFVLEMGMWHEGEIRRLVEISPPDIALLTAIAPAHLGFFSDGLEGIARAKSEIFSHPRTQMALVSSQAFAFKQVKEALKVIAQTWVYGEGGDFLIKTEQEGIVIEEKRAGLFSPIMQTGLKAAHLLENLLAAVTVARLLGMKWEEIALAVPQLRPAPLRYEIEEREGVTFVKDCYNANPLTMRLALLNLPKPQKGGRRLAVLGTMTELGRDSALYHKEVGEIALGCIDELFCIGEESLTFCEVFQKQKRQATHFADLSSLKERLFKVAKPGDVVLIKGSNFLKLWQVLDAPLLS